MIAIPPPIFARYDRQQPSVSTIDAERTQLELEQFNAAALVKGALRSPAVMSSLAERCAERIMTQLIADTFEAVLTNDTTRLRALWLEAFGAAVNVEAESLAAGQLEDVIADEERACAERLVG